MIMHAIWSRLRALTSQPHWWAEVWSSVVLTGWGLICSAMPGEINKHHTFNVLINIAPEGVWERMVFAAGAFQLAALLVNDWKWRALGAFFSSALLSVILWNFIIGNHWFPSVSMYFGYVGINLMAMYKNIRRKP